MRKGGEGEGGGGGGGRNVYGCVMSCIETKLIKHSIMAV